MASWLGGLSSSLGCYLGPVSHSMVSFTGHISRCTKDAWVMEYKTEESSELRRKEVETTKESIRPKVERLMTFYTDIDLENKQETVAYNDLLIKGNLDIKLFIRKETLENQKLQNLQEDIQSVNAAAGFVPSTSSTLPGENIDPKASEYKYELQQKNLEMMILREIHEIMYHKLLKLQKATKSTNATTSFVPTTPASISLGDNINHNASEYEHQLKQQNLEMKILRGRNVAMKHKLLKLRKATQCLSVAAGLHSGMSSASLGENIDPNAPEYKHEFKQKNLEVKILRGRNVAMKHKLLKLQKATQYLNAAAGLLPATPASISLAENISHSASEYKNQLEQQNLEMKILRRRNVAMKHKLFKLQKATECLNAAADFLPAMSSASLDETINPNASGYELKVKQQNLTMKILKGRHVAMKHKLFKLQKATECLNEAAGLLPAMSSASLGENINPNAFEYKHELEQKNLEVKILRGRNVAMKHKLLRLRKATQCLNVAAGLIPAMPALTSLGDNVDHSTSKYEHEPEQKNLEVKILRGRNVVLKRKLLRLRKATQCLNVAAGLLPAMPVLTSKGNNIDHNASEYKNQLEQQNLEMKIQRGRNVAMKHKLFKLQKATECLNAAADFLPAMSSASLGETINPNASGYELKVKQQNLTMKILKGRHVAMKHKLLKLQKATECLNEAAGLLPAISSASLDENISPNASEHKHELEQKNLEVKILRGRNVAMKNKLLKLCKATQCLNMAAGLEPAMPAATSLGDNMDHSAPECKNQVKQQNLEMKILRGRNVAMKYKLLKLQKAIQCLSAAVGLLPATSSASLGENIDPNASEHKHELELKILEMKILRERHEAMKRKLIKLQNANQSINVAAHLIAAMPALTSLGDNNPNASEYEHHLELKSIDHHVSSTYQQLQNRMTQWIWSKVFPTF